MERRAPSPVVGHAIGRCHEHRLFALIEFAKYEEKARGLTPAAWRAAPPGPFRVGVRLPQCWKRWVSGFVPPGHGPRP